MVIFDFESGHVNFIVKTFGPLQNFNAVFRYIENHKTKQK